jgi:aminoglycoside phosphotransferase (APT) family kinase protein
MPTLPPREYSERLGVIDGAQLQRACDEFDLGAVEDARPASAGLWGQNVILRTTIGEFVLRGNPQPPEQLAKERAVAAHIHDRSSLPAPWPYLVSGDEGIFGWPFAILPLLEGSMGATLWEAADPSSKLLLAVAHGEALARLHEATFATPGPYDPPTETFVAVEDYRSWTLDRVQSLRARCRAIDALSPEAERYIDEVIERSSEALLEPLVPTLVHHDFSLANTNYATVDGRYRATGVFDLGEAHLGDGEEDLVRFIFRRKAEQRAAFVAAYADRRPFRPGASDRLALYALADLLFMWEVSQRLTNWFGAVPFVETAEPVIRAARMAAS